MGNAYLLNNTKKRQWIFSGQTAIAVTQLIAKDYLPFFSMCLLIYKPKHSLNCFGGHCEYCIKNVTPCIFIIILLM